MNKLFIREELKKLRITENVNYVGSVRGRDGKGNLVYFLKAGFNNGCETALTQKVTDKEYFLDPLEELGDVMGKIFCEEFVRVKNTSILLNKNNLASIKERAKGDKNKVLTTITFTDGREMQLPPIDTKYFKEFKQSIERAVEMRIEAQKKAAKQYEGWEDEEELPSIDDDYYK